MRKTMNKVVMPPARSDRKRLFFFLCSFFFVLLLVVAGIIAITQEADGEDAVPDDMLPEYALMDFSEDGFAEETQLGWMPPGPPRWFRSNAGGMALEEIPSRLSALRNTFALVIDYVDPVELDARLQPFYKDGYAIEIRILYEKGEEARKQWLFRDGRGYTRLNAVFRELAEKPASEEESVDSDANGIDAGSGIIGTADNDSAADAAAKEPSPVAENAESAGFIELFNEHSLITADYWLFEDGGEILVEYFYNRNTLIRAETKRKAAGNAPGEYTLQHTDRFRYNRSASLRNEERFYHETAGMDPVFLAFPSRVLDAASNDNFLSDSLSVGSEFLGTVFVSEGFRMLYETDSRGRILTQTMVDGEDEVVWVIANTWVGDRIISTLKTEGLDGDTPNEKLTEYEYDSNGNRIVQRDINNGILERLVRFDGNNETEELYLNGVVVLRAHWENGRKIREERVRR